MRIELAQDEADSVLVHEALMMMNAEALVPVEANPTHTMEFIFELMRGPDSCVLMAMNGDYLAGTIGLCKSAFWCNRDRHYIGDQWLYVVPKERHSKALPMLLDAAKQVGDDACLPVVITINNGRRARGPRSDWERTGLTVGFTPRGAVLAHFPAEN